MLSDNILVLELVESDTYDFFSLIELSAAIGLDYGEHEIRTVMSCLVVNNFKIKYSEYY